MTAGRPIGKKIVDLCLELEKLGYAGSRELGKLAGIDSENAGKYCSRAVGLGLMKVNGGAGTKASFRTFQLVEDWREIAKVRRTTKHIEPVRREKINWAGVNSIFAFGKNA